MLDSMPPHGPVDDWTVDTQVITQRAEETRQLAHQWSQSPQCLDASRYNLRRRDVHFKLGDRVWVWAPIRRRGLSENVLKRYFGPYKVLRRLEDPIHEMLPGGTRRAEVVHVVRLRPFYTR